MKLLGDKVIVLPNGGKSVTDGGIFLPQSAIEKRNSGKVVAIGTKVPETLLDRDILFNRNIGTTFDYNKQECLLIHTLDVIAILK